MCFVFQACSSELADLIRSRDAARHRRNSPLRSCVPPYAGCARAASAAAIDSRNSAATADDNYWMFDPADPYGTVTNLDDLLTPDTGSPTFPVSFGEDHRGNLYIAYLVSGDVYRIQTTVPPAPTLDIQLEESTNIVVLWGTNFPGFALETTAHLGTAE